MSEENTAQATEAELRDRCDYRCLNGADCEGPHFMGYSLGPWSITGMMRKIDELRAEVERLQRTADAHDCGIDCRACREVSL